MSKSSSSAGNAEAPNETIRMPYRFLGDTGLLVSALSFGSWVTFSTQIDTTKSYELMKLAYENGINFFDNAEVYASGEAEIIMGQCIQKGIKDKIWQREDLVISTKLYFGDGTQGPNRTGCNRKHLLEGTKNSLQRLKLEYVDLLLCHRRDYYTPIEETVRAMNYLIEHGYALYWGTSEWNSTDIIEANEIAEKLGLIGPKFEQPQYNILERSKVEHHCIPLYKRYKYGLTVFSPLASGALTGKYSGLKIPENSRLSLTSYSWLKPSILEKAKKADLLKHIAEKIGCTLGQMAIAWCLANKNVSTVILGATTKEQLIENLNAIKHVNKITFEISKEIDEAIKSELKPEIVDPNNLHMRGKYIED